MADDALTLPSSTRNPISVVVQTSLDDQIYERGLARNVALALILGYNGYKSSFYGIGTPRKEGLDPSKRPTMWVTGVPDELPRKVQAMNSMGDTFQFLNKTRQMSSSVTRHTSMTDNNAVMPNWQDNTLLHTLKRPTLRWCYPSVEVPVPKDHIMWTADGGAVPKMNLIVQTTQDQMSTLAGQIEQDLHVATGPTDTGSDYWSHPYSFKQACRSDGVYLGIDRDDAANAWWRGYTTASVGSMSFMDMYNYDNLNTSGPQFSKFGYGPVKYYLCNGTLFEKALHEAKINNGQSIAVNKLPEMPEMWFASEGAVKIGQSCWVIHDPAMASGEVFGMNPKAWVLAVKKLFAVGDFFDQSKIVGGPRKLSAQLECMYMLGCAAPWTQSYRTGCT